MSFGTISIVSQPFTLEPTQTDGIWWVFNATASALANATFNYYVDLWSWDLNPSSVYVNLGNYKLPPRPVSGYGIFTPHRLLRSTLVNKYLSEINLSGVSKTYGALEQYWLEYGFIVDPNYQYYDFMYVGGTWSLVSNTPIDLQVGDVIFVDKTNQKVNLQYNGYTTVTQVISATAFATGVTYSGVSTPPGTDGGYITSLKRVSQSTGTQSGNSNYAWNADRQYWEKGVDLGLKYTITSTASSFLTTYEYSPSLTSKPINIKPIRENEYEVLSFISDGYNYPLDRVFYTGYNSNNTILEVIGKTFPINLEENRFDLGVGPQNVSSFFSPSFLSTTDWYRITLGGPTPIIFNNLNNGNFNSTTASWTVTSLPTAIAGISLGELFYIDLVGTGNGSATQNNVMVNNKSYTVVMDVSGYIGSATSSINIGSSTIPGPTSTGLFIQTFTSSGVNFGVNFTGQGAYNVSYIHLFDNFNAIYYNNITRRIDRTCTVYQPIQIQFLNSAGGYETWDFIRRNQKTLNIEKVEWRQELPWNYTIGDRQQSVLSQKAEMTYIANTDWLSEYDHTYLQELLLSQDSYMIIGTNSYPIVITDKQWVQKTKITDQIFNLTISFKEAFNRQTQID